MQTVRHDSNHKETVPLMFLALLLIASAFVHFASAQPSVVATVNGGGSPDGVAYDSAKGEIFVVDQGASTNVGNFSASAGAVTPPCICAA